MATTMTAGRLRTRLRLERTARGASDGAGGFVTTYTPLAVVWAALEPLSGRERLVAAQLHPETTHTITIRYRPGITPSNLRAVVGDRVFDIQSVLDVDERHEWLELLCTEYRP